VRLGRETTAFREAIEMSVDDRGTHQPEDDERAPRTGVRRLHGRGRHRRGRSAVALVAPPAFEGAEPLFTVEWPLDVPVPVPGEDPAAIDGPAQGRRDPAPGLTIDPSRLGPTPEVAPLLRPMVDDLLDLSDRRLRATPSGPALPLVPPAPPEPAARDRSIEPATPDRPIEPATTLAEETAAAEATEAAPRPGLFRSFRTWWRDESMARAAQKRAFAAAEAIIRAQVVQEATGPVEKSPTPESYAQAIRGVMSLTEERFQSLGLRSDRLQDELRAIARTMDELRGMLFLGGLEGVGPAAASAIGSLEQRFDALLVGLSEELGRRAEESDRRLAEQVTLQSAELATLLESAVERIRAAIPEGFETVRASIPQEMARVADVIPREFRRVADSIPGELWRIREDHRRELEGLRDAIPAGFEAVREVIPTELAKIVPDQVERVREANAEEFERIRRQIPDELEQVRLTIPVEIERLRATIPEALEKVRGDVAELSVVLHEVIAQFAAITRAASGEGDGAEPR
jgi:hypothetical protein